MRTRKTAARRAVRVMSRQWLRAGGGRRALAAFEPRRFFMRMSNISGRNILQSAALLLGVSLLFSSGCAVPIKAQALDQVKTVAVVGVTQINNMQGPQSPGGQGVTGMVNAVKSMQKADSGQADA